MARPVHESDAEELKSSALEQLAAMVEDIGVKNFAQSLELSTRQVNRILSGVQPNPVERLILCLQAELCTNWSSIARSWGSRRLDERT